VGLAIVTGLGCGHVDPGLSYGANSHCRKEHPNSEASVSSELEFSYPGKNGRLGTSILHQYISSDISGSQS